ncbi:MAG: CDGSH iron-sulfur domain-containing protein [Endomicrobiales bacterium]
MSEEISTEREFEDILRSGKKVVALFYTTWCPFSREFLPVFEAGCRHEAVGGACRVAVNSLERLGEEQKIKVTKDGPYLVSGAVPLEKEFIVADSEGVPVRWEKGERFPDRQTYILCRCGRSKTMPYCDQTHVKTGFKGDETASNKKFMERAETITGPGLILNDVVKLCAIARFCYRAGDTWTLTERSADPKAKETAIQETFDCPSGRLVARDRKTGAPIEPSFSPSISVVEDPPHKVSGPLWVKGCIPVESADGTVYEVRNRVTLCRCGRSKNKPFCDGRHCVGKSR